MAAGSIPLPPIGAAKLLHPDFFRANRKPLGDVELDSDAIATPVVFMLFNEHAGNPHDLTGNTDPILVSNAEWRVKGSGVYVDGIDSNINLQMGGVSNLIPTTDPLTVIIEFTKNSVEAGNEYVFADTDSAPSVPSSSLILRMDTTNGYSFWVETLAGTNILSVGTVTAGRHVLIMHHDIENDMLWVLLDGSEEFSLAMANGGERSPGTNFRIGSLGDYQGLNFTGTIGTFQLYGGLEAKQIWKKRLYVARNLYQGLKPKNTFLVATQGAGGSAYNMDVLFNTLKHDLYADSLVIQSLVTYNLKLSQNQDNIINANNDLVFNERLTDSTINNINANNDLVFNERLTDSTINSIIASSDLFLNSKLSQTISAIITQNVDVVLNSKLSQAVAAIITQNANVVLNKRLTDSTTNNINANNDLVFNEKLTDGYLNNVIANSTITFNEKITSNFTNTIVVLSDLVLNNKLSQAIITIITQNAGIVFNTKMTDAETSQLDAAATTTLATRQKIDLVTTLAANADLIFNNSFEFLTDRSLTVESDVSFNARFTETLSTIITQDVGIAFNIRQTQTENTQVIASPQLTLNQIRKQTAGAGAEILASVILNKKLSDNVSANIIVEQLLSLGLRNQLKQQATLEAQAGVVFSFINTLTIVEQALVNAGISLNTLQAITLDEGTNIAKIVTPDRRTFIIRFEDRTLTVVNEVREIKVSKDDRQLQ